MTVKEFVVKYIDPQGYTIPTQDIMLNDEPVTIRQGMTTKMENRYINGFTGEVHTEFHEFTIISAFSQDYDGPIIAIVYDDPELSWFNSWLFWDHRITRKRFTKKVITMGYKIRENYHIYE